MRVWIAVSVLAAASRGAALEVVYPIGMIVDPGGARLIRSDSSLPLAARPGDLLYSGDRLSGGSPQLMACAAVPSLNLEAAARLLIPADCRIPPVPRDGYARIGAALTRSLSELDDRDSTLKGEGPFMDRVLAAERLADAEPGQAAALYRAIARDFPDAKHLSTQRLFVLDEADAKRRASKPAAAAKPGRTLALLIGVSEFENAQIRSLRFAHEDALLFERFLRSPRGGSLQDDQLMVLTNRQATVAAIRTAFETLLKRAEPNDTVIFYLATHGAVVESSRRRSKGAYIIAYDSDPEDLTSTAVPMAALQGFLRDDLSKAARVLAFVDACRSGTIGTIPERSKLRFAAALDELAQVDSQLFLFTASRPGEVSYEGRQYGGGHGAFTYFLLDAWNGAADADSDGLVTINEVVNYTQARVAEATVDKQHPREAGTMDATVRLADVSQPGVEVGRFDPSLAGKKEDATRSVSDVARPVRTIALRLPVDFDEALAAGRIYPDQDGNAFTAFRQLKQSRRLSRGEVLHAENRLRVALEEQNQRVLLAYLRGEQNPVGEAEFHRAARALAAAMQVSGETPALAARLQFVEGRLAILRKDYGLAQRLLESALRLDNEAAFIYNALGTAHLERASLELARQAFEDASARAPQWAYPRHNLALTLDQMGETEKAIAIYGEAMPLSRKAAYLPYNRGLLLAKVNRTAEAERHFRLAMELDPRLAEPYNALGSLWMELGQDRKAEEMLRIAVAKRNGFTAAEHNLALLLSKRSRTRPEAIQLWKSILAREPGFVESREALASVGGAP